jgi:hypothetical protein
MAGSIAFKEGMRRASPVLLEPMMAVEVETPEDYGHVMGDLSSRRAWSRAWKTWRVAARRSRRGSAGRDVRLLDHAALADPGSRDVHDGIQALREAPKNVAEAIIGPTNKLSSSDVL